MRNGILGSLAALLAGGTIALGQGYYPGNPPGGYCPQQMPMQQMQAMPMAPYAGPGWGPSGSAFQAYPSAGMSMPVMTYPAPAPQAMMPLPFVDAGDPRSAPPVTMTFPVIPGFSSEARPHEVPGPKTSTRRNAPKHASTIVPCGHQPMVDPVPGSALLCQDSSCHGGDCHESSCHDGSCHACSPVCSPVCAPACAPACEPQIPHRMPRGHTGYARIEALYWWIRPQNGPVLFDVQDPRGVTNLSPRNLINDERLGARLTLGTWCNPEQTVGIEASGFYMGRRNSHNPITPVDRPFFDLFAGTENVFLSPPGSSGDLSSQMRLYGGEINLRGELCRTSWGHVDLVAGPRFLQLDESLSLVTNDGAGNTTADTFGTHNQFWGGQLGVDGEVNWKRYFVNGYLKVALGDLRQTVNIYGETSTAGVVTPGGFLAQPSNIGAYRRNRFSVLPEAGLNVGMRLTDHVRMFGGYNVFFLANAVRPGDQIDRNINFAGVGAPGPLFTWRDTTFWAQGLTGGLELRY